MFRSTARIEAQHVLLSPSWRSRCSTASRSCTETRIPWSRTHVEGYADPRVWARHRWGKIIGTRCISCWIYAHVLSLLAETPRTAKKLIAMRAGNSIFMRGFWCASGDLLLNSISKIQSNQVVFLWILHECSVYFFFRIGIQIKNNTVNSLLTHDSYQHMAPIKPCGNGSKMDHQSWKLAGKLYRSTHTPLKPSPRRGMG